MPTDMPAGEGASRHEDDAVLQLSRVGICLHYVEQLPPDASFPPDDGLCNVLASMELDLLAYRFQDPAPFSSRVAPLHTDDQTATCTYGRRPIQIIYPSSFVYHSEGRSPRLTTAKPERNADVLISATEFRNSGVRVWHLTITPRAGEQFNEFEIIKLIHLYDGRTERTGLTALIQFRLAGGQARVTAAGLPALLGVTPVPGSSLELRSGTLELMVGTDDTAEDVHVEVLDTLRKAREEDGESERSQLDAWMDQDGLHRRTIMAYCGIVTGIFDFDKIDGEEALDTLEPTFPASSAFLRIHRRTLICIADDDRSMRECWDTVGISPYLIIPHAALLHNEALVDGAESLLEQALADPKASLAGLETAHVLAERKLHALYLPNVFNYVTERVLFTRGSECRGSDDKRSAVLAKLEQLKGNIEIVREQERNRGQLAIQLLLGLISVLQLKSIVQDMFESEQQHPGVWLVLLLSMIALGVVIWWSQRKGLPSQIAGRGLRPDD